MQHLDEGEKKKLCSKSKLLGISCIVSHASFESKANQSFSKDGVYTYCFSNFSTIVSFYVLNGYWKMSLFLHFLPTMIFQIITPKFLSLYFHYKFIPFVQAFHFIWQ